MSYHLPMMRRIIYDFDPVKNLKLKEERGISFEEIIVAIEEGGLLDIIKHPNTEKYGNQRVYIIAIEHYIYMVPFVEQGQYKRFLKTIFPSRKLTKQYLNKGEGYD